MEAILRWAKVIRVWIVDGQDPKIQVGQDESRRG